MHLIVDLLNREDRLQARLILNARDDAESERTLAVAGADLLDDLVPALLDDESETRRVLVGRIAAVSPHLLPKADLYRASLEIAPDNQPSSVIGGLHSSLERVWKNHGGRDAFGPFFVTTRRGFTMNGDIGAAVRRALQR